MTGKQISGGGGTYDGGTANPKIVVVEGAVSEVVAHEVGHAAGAAAHDANNTVMKPTGAYDAPNSTAVSTDVCTHARSGSVLAKSGAAKDCCYKVGGGLSGAEKPASESSEEPSLGPALERWRADRWALSWARE